MLTEIANQISPFGEFSVFVDETGLIMFIFQRESKCTVNNVAFSGVVQVKPDGTLDWGATSLRRNDWIETGKEQLSNSGFCRVRDWCLANVSKFNTPEARKIAMVEQAKSNYSEALEEVKRLEKAHEDAKIKAAQALSALREVQPGSSDCENR